MITTYESCMAERSPHRVVEYLGTDIGADEEFLEQYEEWYRGFELEEMCEVEASHLTRASSVLVNYTY